MKPASSIGLAVLSTTFFSLALAADQLLVNNGAHYKTFYVEPHDEQVLEQEFSETALKLVAKETERTDVSTKDMAIAGSEQALNPVEQHQLLEQTVNTLRENKDYTEVVKLLEAMSAEQRIAASQQFNYALSLSRTGNHQLAANAYAALLAVWPNHQSAAVNLGLLNNKLRNYEGAKQAFTHAIEISSGSKKAKAHSGLATAHKAQGQMQEAEYNFKKSIEYRPSHASTWLKLAEVQGLLNKPYQEVSLTYQRAISLRKSYSRAWKSYGLYQLDNLNYPSAIENLHKALETSNNDEDIYRALAWAYFENFEQTDSGKYWRWLASNARDAEDRLAASHMLSALRGQPSKLQEFKVGNAELSYIHDVLALLQDKSSVAILSGEPGVADADPAALLKGRISRFQRLKAVLHATPLSDAEVLAWQGANLYQGEVQYLLASEAREIGNYSAALNHINDSITISGVNRRNSLFKYATLIESELHVEAKNWLRDLPGSIQQELDQISEQSLHVRGGSTTAHFIQTSSRIN